MGIKVTNRFVLTLHLSNLSIYFSSLIKSTTLTFSLQKSISWLLLSVTKLLAWELLWLGTWVKHDFFLWLIMVNWNYKMKPGKAEVGRNLLDNLLEKNMRNHKLDFNVKREHSPHSWEIDNYMCQIHTARKEYNCWLSNIYDSIKVKKKLTADKWWYH